MKISGQKLYNTTHIYKSPSVLIMAGGLAGHGNGGVSLIILLVFMLLLIIAQTSRRKKKY